VAVLFHKQQRATVDTCSTAWHSMCSAAQHSMTQHVFSSTAQHDTAHHSVTQCRTNVASRLSASI
jgi:hypothetical protein